MSQFVTKKDIRLHSNKIGWLFLYVVKHEETSKVNIKFWELTIVASHVQRWNTF